MCVEQMGECIDFFCIVTSAISHHENARLISSVFQMNEKVTSK